MMEFELIALGPLAPLAMLIAEPPGSQSDPRVSL
jgi:hypothetical protein